MRGRYEDIHLFLFLLAKRSTSNSTAMSSSPRLTPVSWNLIHSLETVLGDTINLLTIGIGVPSEGLDYLGTFVGSGMLPVMTLILAK